MNKAREQKCRDKTTAMNFGLILNSMELLKPDQPNHWKYRKKLEYLYFSIIAKFIIKGGK